MQRRLVQFITLSIVITILVFVVTIILPQFRSVAIADTKLSPQHTINLLSLARKGSEVVEVTQVKSKNLPISFGKTFTKTEKVFNDLSVEVKNISKKNITHIKIGVHLYKFTKSSQGKLGAIYFLNYGKDTGLPNNKPDTIIKPNEIVNISFSEKNIEIIEKLARDNKCDLSEIGLSTQFIVFEDDTAWRFGRMQRRDSQNLMRWNTIDFLASKRPSATLTQGNSFVSSSNWPGCHVAEYTTYNWCIWNQCYVVQDWWVWVPGNDGNQLEPAQTPCEGGCDQTQIVWSPTIKCGW